MDHVEFGHAEYLAMLNMTDSPMRRSASRLLRCDATYFRESDKLAGLALQ
jgi:hypothetical protein